MNSFKIIHNFQEVDSCTIHKEASIFREYNDFIVFNMKTSRSYLAVRVRRTLDDMIFQYNGISFEEDLAMLLLYLKKEDFKLINKDSN